MKYETNQAGDSQIEMHPALKLILFLSVIQAAAVSIGFRSLAVFTILFLFSVFLLKIDINKIIDKTKPFLLLIIFTFALNLSFGSGLELSTQLSYRFLLIILFSILLTTSTKPELLIAVLLFPFWGKFGRNLKIVLMVAMEFIPYFIDKAKSTVKDIRSMPEYKGKAFKALFKPALYIRPISDGMLDMASDVAIGVEEGKYDIPPLPRIKIKEIALSILSVTLVVLYAL